MQTKIMSRVNEADRLVPYSHHFSSVDKTKQTDIFAEKMHKTLSFLVNLFW